MFLSQVKKLAINVLAPIFVAALFFSCTVRLKKVYYDNDWGTEILSTSTKRLGSNQNGERVVGWTIASRDTIFLVLQLQFSVSNHRKFEIPPGEYLSVDFSDGKNYGLFNSSSIISRRGVILGDYDRIADAYVYLSENDMRTLLSKQIVALDVQTSEGNARFTIKPRKDQAIKKMIAIMRPDLLK